MCLDVRPYVGAELRRTCHMGKESQSQLMYDHTRTSWRLMNDRTGLNHLLTRGWVGIGKEGLACLELGMATASRRVSGTLFHVLPRTPASLSSSPVTMPPKGVLSAIMRGFRLRAKSSAIGQWGV